MLRPRSPPRSACGGVFASIPVPTGKKSPFSDLQTGQSPQGSALTDAN
ncbi:hypothetical protein A2U01_0080449 [Trifolium medium]|uniref:Uncharacterized protein n=1 Tax=Trifolium medium TaxID=97028 RepID=A0A392TF18_9FABA|nr:hypothetical protein [Trifolium medium]